MLTPEIMGLGAMLVLWVNGLLVLAVAFKQLGRVLGVSARLKRAQRDGRLVEGVVRAGAPFAIRHVTQVGRALTVRGPQRILFTDGPQSFEVLGGVLETAEGEIRVEAAQPGLSEVWIGQERADSQSACPSGDTFDAAYVDASKYKGYRREVEVPVGDGDRVWVLGARDGEALTPPESEPLLVSMIEPVRWARSRAWVLGGFLLVAFTALCGVTALAVVPPRFGPVSTVGGILCVAYFLAIQPIATAVRDAIRTPARQPLGGTWQRP